MLSLLVPWIPPGVQAVSDLTPPTLLEASIVSSQSFDSGSTFNYGNVYLHMADDLSGVYFPVMTYVSPSGQQSVAGAADGVDASGATHVNISFPQYAETGVWTPTLTLADLSGNTTTLSNAQLLQAGYDLHFTLTGTGDTTNPEITAVTSPNPGILDASSYSPTTYFTISMSDNMSGFLPPTLTYASQSGNQISNGAGCTLREPSPLTSGVFDCFASFWIYSENGVWTPSIIFSDGAGNTVTMSNAQLLAAGYDLRVNVTGTNDVTPPAISNLEITYANPPADNVPYGGAAVTIKGNITDNLSGFAASSNISYTSPSGHATSEPINYADPQGNFSTTIYLPSYTEGGTWTPTITAIDANSNTHVYSNSELVSLGYNLDFTVTKNITETAAPGGTVTSDYEGNGATDTDPIEASVTTPTGGPISIVIVSSEGITDPTNGYTFFGRQISIVAPQESVESPLTLKFRIDSTLIPSGQSAETLQITRNGNLVSTCNDQSTAAPDPCIFVRETLPDGDIQVSVHTTRASSWASGFPTSQSSYSFNGFNSPVADYPYTNSAQAGQTVPLKFELKNAPASAEGVLDEAKSTTQRVNCLTLAEIGSPQAALSANNEGLKIAGKSFAINWKTDKNWTNSCRLLKLRFNNGTVAQALFQY